MRKKNIFDTDRVPVLSPQCIQPDSTGDDDHDGSETDSLQYLNHGWFYQQCQHQCHQWLSRGREMMMNVIINDDDVSPQRNPPQRKNSS